jgi:hypothetical protein
MRNYKDLHVWEKAHTLTLAVYRDTQLFPYEDESDSALVFFYSSESRGGLRQEVRWRDGSLRPDSDGIRC